MSTGSAKATPDYGLFNNPIKPISPQHLEKQPTVFHSPFLKAAVIAAAAVVPSQREYGSPLDDIAHSILAEFVRLESAAGGMGKKTCCLIPCYFRGEPTDEPNHKQSVDGAGQQSLAPRRLSPFPRPPFNASQFMGSFLRAPEDSFTNRSVIKRPTSNPSQVEGVTKGDMSKEFRSKKLKASMSKVTLPWVTRTVSRTVVAHLQLVTST